MGSDPDPVAVADLEAALRLPRPLCALLVARGFEEAASAKAFLRPLLTGLHPPNELPDLPQAVARILEAIDRGETLFVHGDYDVDGMAGTALLTHWLRRLGGKVVPFIPHRVRDGYDLGAAGLAAAEGAGATLLITVDCGTLAFDTVEEANRRGMTVLVTDHHATGDRLPDALAVVNPSRKDSRYPFPALCGAGVAFKLCQGLAAERGIGEEDLYPFLDLVGMATIADLVPLEGENRILARYGLKALSQTARPGLRALMAESRIDPASIKAGNVGFGLAPRLNALGRLGEPMDGLRLLMAVDPAEARALAQLAERINRERQDADRRILDEALALLSDTFDPEEDFGVVLASEGWHPGVVGIVASRLVERIHRPVVLVALEGEEGRGSARSIPDYHLLDGIRACSHHLDRFGGHRQAAGLQIQKDALAAFKEDFNQVARASLEGRDLRPSLRVEVEVDLSEMSSELLGFLGYLGPHGIGNPGPSFLARGLTVSSTPRVVGGDHLKLSLRQGSSELEAIGFHMASRIPPDRLGRGPVDAVFHLQANEFRGVRTLQGNLKDIRPSEGA